MNALIIASILLVTPTLINCKATVGTESRVIEAIAKRFSCNCIVLLSASNGMREASAIAKTRIELMQRLLSTAHVQLRSLLRVYSRLHKTCSTPLIVLLRDSALSAQHMSQVSISARVPGAVWLLFHDEATSLDSLFDAINIPFDCELLAARLPATQGKKIPYTLNVCIYEVYRVSARASLQSPMFGCWSRDNGLVATASTLVSRRNNLQGLTLQAVSVNDIPLVVLRKIGNKTRMGGGLIKPIWAALETALNLTFDIRTPETGSFGIHMSNGSWSGIIGMVNRSEVDVGIFAMSNAPDRAPYVDYSVPVVQLIFNTYISELDGRDVSWNNFLYPFTARLWLAVMFTAAATAALLAITSHFTPSEEHALSPDDATLIVFGAVFCLQSSEANPRAYSLRLVVLLAYILGVLVMSSYSAFLTSSFTVIRPRIPFTSLQGLLEDGTYELQPVRNGAVMMYLQESDDPLLRAIYKRHTAPGMSRAPETQGAIQRRVCSGKFAALTADIAVQLIQPTLPCRLYPMDEVFLKTSVSFAVFPKNSPYKKLFDSYVLKIAELGIVKVIIARVAKQYDPGAGSFSGITLEQVTPMLAILVVGVACSFACALVEALRECRARAKQRHQDTSPEQYMFEFIH